MQSRDDLGDLSRAAFLGTKSSHTRSTVGHGNLLAIFDGSVGFALHTVAFDS